MRNPNSYVLDTKPDPAKTQTIPAKFWHCFKLHFLGATPRKSKNNKKGVTGFTLQLLFRREGHLSLRAKLGF